MIDVSKYFVSFTNFNQVRIDNSVFRLHYRFTVVLLLLFTILLSSKQYFGDPITCLVDHHKQLIETYCWIYGTYVLKSTLHDRVWGIPGVGTYPHKVAPWMESEGNEIIWQRYYQWVCIVFSIQALMFYTPWYMWKVWEGGQLKILVKELKGPLVNGNWNTVTKQQLVQYIVNGGNQHNLYALRYTICEVLNFVNVILQFFITDWFLNGYFFSYGFDVLNAEGISPMLKVFPKITKCLLNKYGPSGTWETLDALCILPLNILNEKLFLILWFWLVILSVVTFLSLIYRSAIYLSHNLRCLLLMSRIRYIGNKPAKSVTKQLSYGDFFILYHIGRNVNPIVFKELVLELYEVLAAQKPFRSFAVGHETNSI